MVGGCTTVPEPDKPAEEVIKEGMANLSSITSYKYDVSLKGDMKDPNSGDVKFDFMVNGAVDVKDMKDPKVSVKLNGSAQDAEGTSGSAKAEMVVNKDAVYFNLMSLDLGEEGLLPPDVKDYMGKWWMIELPPEVLNEMAEASEDMDADSEEMKEMLENAKLFNAPEYVGGESVMGDPSWRYKVTVDKEAFVEFAKETAEREGTPLSASEIAEAEAAFENVDIVGDVWVSSTSNVVNQFKGTMNFKGEAGESGVLTVSVTLGDINKPVTLSVPSGAEEFPLEELLGPLMMGGMMADPTMMGDPTMMDPSMFDDEMMMDFEGMEGFEDFEGMEGMEFDESMFDEAAFEEELMKMEEELENL